MPSIIFRHVFFSHTSATTDVFAGLDLLIDTGWRTGLVGRNGIGKSTLLRLLSGDYMPQAGSLDVPVATRLFPPLSISHTFTVREVMRETVLPYSEMTRRMDVLLAKGDDTAIEEYALLHEAFMAGGGYELDARVEMECAAMGLAASMLDRPFASLSGGEQTRALIASLFTSDHGYALIDEPTNHLDADGRRLLAAYLNSKPGFLLVSHDREFLDETVDHVVSLNRADVRVNRGNFSTWRAQMDREIAGEAATRENIEREVRQLRDAALMRRQGSMSRERDKYGPGAGSRDKGFIGHRAAKQMKRALAVERRVGDKLEEKSALLANREKDRALQIETSRGLAGPLVTVNGLDLDRGGRRLFCGLSFQISCGERLAVTGGNGTGKSSLLDVICGELNAGDGLVSYRPGLVISRVYQQPRWTTGRLQSHLEEGRYDESRFRQFLGVLGVEAEACERDLASFSEGQRKKVELTRALMQPADLLVWDEPLNYVDLATREQIESAVLEGGPTMLFVEHDRKFTSRVGSGQIELGTPQGIS